MFVNILQAHVDDYGQRNRFSVNHGCVFIYISIFIYILKPGMVQKLICHFSIEMLKIFCLRDTPSAWLTWPQWKSQIVVNKRVATWPTLRSFGITRWPCPQSLRQLGNNTDQGSILIPEKNMVRSQLRDSATSNPPESLVVCFKLIKGLRKEEFNFENKMFECYLLSTIWVICFSVKQSIEKLPGRIPPLCSPWFESWTNNVSQNYKNVLNLENNVN